MSVPSSYTMPENGPHRPLQEELAQHRAKVFEALSRHSDPTIREIGRQLASGAMAPHELLKEPQYVDALRRRMAVLTAMDSDDLHRRVFGVPKPGEEPGHRPRSGPDDHDGGVPAVRR
jgi:hypothetical protein